VLSFAYKHWDGHVPDPGELRAADLEILDKIESGFQTAGAQLDAVHLRAALNEVMRLASEVNKYLDDNAPWFEIKSDKNQAAKTINTALQAIDSLKVLFAPFLPFSSERLNIFLGHKKPLFGEQFVESVTDSLGEHSVLRYRKGEANGSWEPSQLPAGQILNKPSPLFKKLEPGIADEERARLG